MKSHIQALEERANAATIQSTVFGQLAAESIPKNLQCVDIKLTADWLQNKSIQELADESRNSPRLVDNNLYHFCIFSDNLLAVSVVVNSTVSNAEHPKQLVFHIVTNGVKYGAMQAWFLSNDFKGAAVEVQNIEDFTWLNASYSPVVKQLLDADSRQYFFETSQVTSIEPKFHNPKYLSLLNHLRFYIPEIYPQLEKEQNVDKSLWKLGSLPPALLAFYGLTEPLDRRWHVLGLGYDLNIDNRLIETAAVIHFNGNMKPWLKLSIGRYRPLWEQYVNQTHRYLQDCVTS
ncbi:UNVERIFIED_CONTAM: putative galacturonosyltransferase 11 [Sesamum radiatum]|uniref:Hexosyltransferase n=1 Tax=Sesamum radiatum TaxID=300843 RepID=A0AAW2PI36_SESRA